MSLSAGARLGPYEVLTLLGAGGMGEVYKARDTRLDRTVAIKILPETLAGDPQFRERFEREAKAIAALTHPHICTLYDVGRHEGIDYLVMEHLEGQTLADRLTKGALPLDQALAIATQIADALSTAHRAGITHRDLKPGNVMLTKSGAKLLDFGLAKASAPVIAGAGGSMLPTSPPNLTAQGAILGTFQYMAPEQLEGQEADARTDIFAFGAVVYEMLTGRRAFEGKTQASLISAILKDIPPPVSNLKPLTPASLDRLVTTCLAKDPDERWQSAADLCRELKWITESDSPIAVRRASTPRVWSGRLLPWAIVAIVALLGGAFLVTRAGSGPAGSASRGVIRVDMNMPFAVEAGTTSTPNVAISPDGERVAFIGGLGGLRRLYVRRFDESEATPLRGTETVNVCFFSPDGRALGFITSDRILKKVSLSDGLVTTVVADADTSGGGVWVADDHIVFVRGGPLWEIPATGGTARQLTKLDKSRGESLHAWPAAVAGGKAILFTTVIEGERTAIRIEALTRATGERHTVVGPGSYPMYASSGHIVFFREKALLAAPFDADSLALTGPPIAVLQDVSLDQLGSPMVALSPAGVLAYVSGYATRRLVWVSRQGVEEPIIETPRPYQNPRLEPNGRRIIVEVAGGDLWIQDIERATFTRLTSADTVGNTFAVWTPDRHVVFRTLTGFRLIDPDAGGHAQAIPGTSVADIPSAVSPDGQTLAFIRQTPETGGDMYALSLHGDPQPRPVVKTPGYDGGGQFSPDGHWMAYASNESGQFEVYVHPYPGPDRKRQVSGQGGTHPKWNPNGKELFYRNGNKMMVVDVSRRDGDLMLGQPRVLFEQRYAFGTAQTIASYDVSSDGQRFVMVKDDSSSGRLNIVINWFEELKRLVPTK